MTGSPPPRPGPPKWYWRQQPAKAIYVALYGTSVLLRIPFWIIAAALGFRPRKSWSIHRTVAIRALRHFQTLFVRCDLRLNRDLLDEPRPSTLKATKLVWAPAVEHDRITGFVREQAEINQVKPVRVPCFWYKRPDDLHKPFARAQANETVLLSLHGGAYMLGTAAEMDTTALLPKGLIKHTKIGGILAADYRLAQDNPFPSALIDAFSAYAYLIDECGYEPSKIIVVGDSAGGNLTHALLRYIRDEKPYPMPAGQLLFSPWSDMTLSPTRSGEANFKSDMLDREMGPRAVEHFFHNLPDSTRGSPYCSPGGPMIQQSEWPQVFADFPPTLMSVGGAERLHDEIDETRRRYAAAGNEVRWVYEKDAPHDYCIFPFCEPERTHTLKEVGKWVDEVLS